MHRGCMVSVLRSNLDIDSERWPALTRSLVAAASVASSAVDLAIRQFRTAPIFVESDEAGEPSLVPGADGSRWIYAYSRQEWVPGIDAGQDIEVLCLTGLELTRRLPKGTGVCLDSGQSHSLVLVAAEIRAPIDEGADADSVGGTDL